MNIAIDLIMAAVFFAMTGVRLAGVDLLPDCIGFAALLVAVSILRKREDSFREAYYPGVVLCLLSVWNFFNLLPDTPSLGFMLIYVIIETGIVLAEYCTYRKLFDGFSAYYGRPTTKGNIATVAYGITSFFGVIISATTWLIDANEDFYYITIIYLVWVAVNIVVSTYLVYRFYLLKPKYAITQKGRKI